MVLELFLEGFYVLIDKVRYLDYFSKKLKKNNFEALKPFN